MGVFLHLYTTFFKIGALAFGGGYAVLPLIEQFVINENAWLTARELTDLISLSQMTPGPIAINSATFIGTKVAGIPGAIIATLGNVTPQFILMMTLGYFIFSGRKIKFLDKILKGLKPAIVGLIAIATINMIESSLFTTETWSLNDWSLLGVVGFILGIVLYRKKTLSVIQLVLLSAAVGVGLHGIMTIL